MINWKHNDMYKGKPLRYTYDKIGLSIREATYFYNGEIHTIEVSPLFIEDDIKKHINRKINPDFDLTMPCGVLGDE